MCRELPVGSGLAQRDSGPQTPLLAAGCSSLDCLVAPAANEKWRNKPLVWRISEFPLAGPATFSRVWSCPGLAAFPGVCSLVRLALPSCGWQQIFKRLWLCVVAAQGRLSPGIRLGLPTSPTFLPKAAPQRWWFRICSGALSLPMLFWTSLTGLANRANRHDWFRIYLFTLKYNQIFKRRSLLVLLSLTSDKILMVTKTLLVRGGSIQNHLLKYIINNNLK